VAEAGAIHPTVPFCCWGRARRVEENDRIVGGRIRALRLSTNHRIIAASGLGSEPQESGADLEAGGFKSVHAGRGKNPDRALAMGVQVRLHSALGDQPPAPEVGQLAGSFSGSTEEIMDGDSQSLSLPVGPHDCFKLGPQH
jgi:hypothetical protein